MDQRYLQLIEACVSGDAATFKQIHDDLLLEKIIEHIRERAAALGLADPFAETARS
jgi:hypothetical protein